MNSMTRVGLAAAAVAVLTVGGVTTAQGSGAPVDPVAAEVKPAAPENGVCRKSFGSGSGQTRFAWCFGADGSINQIEHPAGQEHTGVTEGFCLASGSSTFVTHGSVFGDLPRAGLNAPTYPAANKVVHTTTDGAFRIEQTFTQVTATKTVVITMKLTNTSGAPRANVTLTRWIDADMSGTPSNDVFFASTRSAVAAEPKVGIASGARLELLPATTGLTAYSLIFDTFRPSLSTACHNEGALTNPSATGDKSMGAEYYVGTVGGGASKTVQFTYRTTI